MERRSRRSFRGGFIIFVLLSGFKVSFPFPARPWHLFCHGDVQRGKRCKMWAVPWDGDRRGLGNLSSGFGKGLRWPWGSPGARRCPARGSWRRGPELSQFQPRKTIPVAAAC